MKLSPLQRRALEAMGFAPMRLRVGERAGDPSPAGGVLREVELPLRLRGGLERWVGAQWADWPAPPGVPGDAGFKRALWRRVRDGRCGG